MTSEEAIERIQALYNDWLPIEYDFEVFDTEENKLDREAFVLAIEALKAKSEIENSKSEIKNAKTEISMSKSKMTNEEAIKELKTRYLTMSQCLDKEELHKANEALDLAIKVLEQQTCEDCISREAVNVLIDELARAISDERCFIPRGRSTANIMQDILDLPSVTPSYNLEPYSDKLWKNAYERGKAESEDKE